MYQTNKTPPPDFSLAARIGEGVLQEKLKDYQKAKEATLEILPVLQDSTSPLKKHYTRIEECGTYLVFRVFYTVEQTRVIRANLCKKRLLCDLCALRTSAMRVQAFIPKLEQVLFEFPQYDPYLVTFTVKNGPDLLERYNHLTGSYSRIIMNRRRDLSSGRTNTIYRHVIGGTMQVELKIGSGSGLWHSHIHSIIMLPRGVFDVSRKIRKAKDVYVPYDFENSLRAEWSAITDDSHMVDVRRIQVESDEERIGAICEAHKYPLKPGSLTPEQRIYAAEKLHAKRMYRSFGCFYGVDINENLIDSIEAELELLPYVDLVYTYNNEGYSLKEITDYGKYKEAV